MGLLAASACTAAEPPANVVTNPGFESGAAPWVARGAASLLVSAQAHTGTGSAWVTNRTAGWNGVAQSLLGQLRPGGSYFCAAWARAESATSQVLRLTFEQRDGAGTRFISVANAAVTNNAWTFLSGNFSLNVTGALADIIIYVEGPAAGVDMRVDNVAVVPLSGLRLAAGQRTVRFGGISESSVNTDRLFGRVVGTDYPIAGTENSLKFSGLHPGSNTYSFSSADAILDHATAHGQLSRGHALLWHGSVPNWIASNAWTTTQLQTFAYDHIDTVVSRYRDRLFCWDVVNEAFNTDGSLRSTVSITSSDLSFDFEIFAQHSLNHPILAVQATAGQLQLSWPAWAVDYVVQTTTNFSPPIIWGATTNVPVLSNNEWRVALPVATTNGARFHRLQTP